MSNTNKPNVMGAKSALDNMKMEVAQEFGIDLKPKGQNQNLTAYEAGRIGGEVTKRLVELAEQTLANRQ